MKIKTFALSLVMLISAVSFSGCNEDKTLPPEKPTTEHIVMMTAVRSNWGENDISQDFFKSENWTVYYDGAVEVYDIYNLSGNSSTDSYKLSEADLNEIYDILSTKLMNIEDDHSSACDGEGWSFTYFDEKGNIMESYNGYIYSNETLSRLAEILNELTK